MEIGFPTSTSYSNKTQGMGTPPLPAPLSGATCAHVSVIDLWSTIMLSESNDITGERATDVMNRPTDATSVHTSACGLKDARALSVCANEGLRWGGSSRG